MITFDKLKRIAPYGLKIRLLAIVEPLNLAMREYDINTKQRMAAFISQCAHETASFNYLKEIASGKAYEGRVDLGNTQKGDGEKFPGRGLIHCTGRKNYEEVSKALGLDLISKPEMLEIPLYAAMSAAYWWKKHGLNEIADKPEDWTHEHNGRIFTKTQWITHIVNGGQNGIASRESFYKKAMGVL